MTIFSSFKKALLILLSLGLISTVNAMKGQEDEKYCVAVSANYKTFEEIDDFRRVIATDNLRESIDNIVQRDQHLIFMIKGSFDKSLDTILEVFDCFIKQTIKDPTKICRNLLYSGGLEDTDKMEEDMEEDDGETPHNVLVVGKNVKQLYESAIKNVYAPQKKGYSIEFDQARIFYEITDPNQLAEFWHTEPAAMEQFLIWRLKEKQLKNVIIVSKKPMCKFCSSFLLHCFYIESMKKSDVNFIVFSLSALENISKADEVYLLGNQQEKISPLFSKLRELLLTVVGNGEMNKSGSYKDVNITIFDKIKTDLKGVSGNNLSIYGF